MIRLKKAYASLPFSKNELWVVFGLILLSFILRTFSLHENLFFGYEQGRDLIKVQEILRGDVILLGPKTDIDGVFHGALSYYVLIPFYLLTFGNPYGILLCLILFHCLSLVLLYTLVRSYSDKYAAVFASGLFAVSYPLIIYSRWLSNPNLVVPLTVAIFFCLFYAKLKPTLLIAGSIFFALLIHLQVAVAGLIFPLVLYLIFRNKLYKNKAFWISFVSFIVMLLPYAIFELKNDFLMTSSFIRHFQEERTEVMLRSNTFNVFLDQLTDFFFIEKRWLSLITLLGITAYGLAFMRKNKLFIFSVLAVFTPPFLFYLANFRPLRHFYNAEPVFLILLVGLVLGNLFKKNKAIAIAAFAILLFSNLQTYKNRIPENVANFLYHAQRMYLSDEKKVIDYAYARANGKPFSYDYYSIPYWKSEAWEYMFNWYGVGKYGYRPGADRLDTFYVFMEPDESQPVYQKNWYRDLDKEATVVDTFKSRHLTVEERTRIKK